MSHSSLSAFEACPFSFYLRYYHGVRWPDNENMILGSQFQNALNLRYSGADYADAINKIAPEFRDTAKELIGKAYDFDNIISLDKEYTQDFGVGIPVKFIPDILTTTTVVENKYSGGYYNERMVKQQKQGTIYYYGVKLMTGKAPEVKYQIFNKVDKTVKLIPVEKTEQDVVALLEWMRTTIGRIEACYRSGNWTINQHGKWKCDLGDACPIAGAY